MRVPTILADDFSQISERLGNRLQPLSGTTMALTGAGGFLGSYLLGALSHWNRTSGLQPCTIYAIDNFVVGNSTRIGNFANDPNIIFLKSDITQTLELDVVDWLIHCASIASPSFFRQFPLETMDANITGTRIVLEKARTGGAKGVLLLSSSEIYGNPSPENIPTPETYLGNVSCIGPRACYDESKRAAETLAWIYYNHHDVPVKTVRPFNVYGPGQRLDDGRIIPDLIGALLSDEPLTLYSNGKATRAFCYVSDATTAMLSVLTDPNTVGESYNVGNDETEITISDLADLAVNVGQQCLENCKSVVEFGKSNDSAYTTHSPVRRCPNLTKIRETIGYRPQVTLYEGLSRTLQSYSSTEQASPKLTPNK